MRGAGRFARLEADVRVGGGMAPGETVLAAVSGGSDSTALAGLLASAARRFGATLVLGHVNHATRPSAWQDEGVVLALAAALGLRVVVASLPPGPADEARLRAARYATLAALARRVGARRIMTGHHARDQAETVLLALLRGTGPDGLAGMAPVRPLEGGLSLERPLLSTEPEELAAYCASCAFPYAVDPTNADPSYRRNALRLALAGLREAFPHLDAAVARCSTILREERAGSARAEIRGELRAALTDGPGTRDVSFERLEAAARALERGARGRHFLRHGVEVVIE